MYPTLKPGSMVLVSKIPYFFNSPKTRDLIAVKDPRNGKVLIKRISKIERDKFFVIGDNKNYSTDSRTFGSITINDIIGKVVYESKKT